MTDTHEEDEGRQTWDQVDHHTPGLQVCGQIVICIEILYVSAYFWSTSLSNRRKVDKSHSQNKCDLITQCKSTEEDYPE